MYTDNYFKKLLFNHNRYLVEEGGGTDTPPNPEKFMSDSTDVIVDTPAKVEDTPPPPPPAKKEDTPPPPTKKDEVPPPPTSTDYKPADIWDVMKEELSTPDKPWELPDILKTGKKADGTPLTKKEELALLRETISSNTQFDDEFVNDYLEAKESGVPVQEFVKSKAKALDFQNLTVDDKVKMYYEDYAKANNLKWTPEQIEAKLKALTDVDKDMQAKAYESYLSQKEKENYSKAITEQNAKFETNYNKAETDNNQLVTNYLKNIEGKNTVAGIELSEAEMTQYKKDLPTFMKRVVKTDEKTGMKYAISPAEELLSEILAKPENTFDLLPYLYMVKNGKLKGYSNRLKENIKKNVDETLDSKPDVELGRSGVSGPNAQKFMAD